MKIKIKEAIKRKEFVILAIIVCTIMAIALTSLTVKIVKEVQIKKMQETPLLTYEIKSGDEEVFNILIKITSLDGIEEVTYKKRDSDDEMTIYCDGKNIVAINYIIYEYVKYDFKIKQVGKEEVIETIYFETPYIPGDYTLVNGVYSNVPDLTGYDEKYTRYLVSEGESLQVGKWVNSEKPENWYSYNDSKWANIYIENNGVDTYYTWIPRYCFKLDQENQRSDVKFIDVFNNYKDENGNVTTWRELKKQGYQVPEAFKWDGTKIPGYWAMKYTAGDVITPSILYYDMYTYKGVITVSNITLNTSITNSNPIVKYTFALNGEIIQTIEDKEQIANIGSQIINFTNLKEGENTVNVTGLNAEGKIVGSMTKIYAPVVVNEPDTSKFNQDTTFYVTYDDNGNEHSTIPISKEEPEDWYEYGESRWANIVTRNNGLETYYTWIPRYEFTLDQTNQRSTVKFLTGTSTNVTPGYQIPEAFTFNGVELTGYWAMKYTAGDEYSAIFNTELTATGTSIKTGGITGSAVANGEIYKYYINGEFKHETTDKSEIYEYTGLEVGQTYTVLVEIRQSSTDKYLGSIVKQVKTVEPNKPELTGFNESMTYYVTYAQDGTEIIGANIKNDGSNIEAKDWYDYSTSKWANIVVTDGTIVDGKITNATMITYYTWIPRYQFRLDQTNQRSIVRFIEGSSTTVDDGYQIPEAFTFNGKELTGYWAMKYTAGE